MKKILFTLFLAITAYSTSFAGGKIYAVLMGATSTNIGPTCKIDLDRFENELATLSMNLDMDLAPILRYDGSNCDKEHLEMGLSKLRSGSSDDIILFYYTGHGGRTYSDKTDWPQMCLKYSDPHNYVHMSDVVDKMNMMPARLKIVLADCCNSYPKPTKSIVTSLSKGPTDVSDINYANLEKLFLQQKGTIINTSSKVGQPSGCDDRYGGWFTISFWEAINSVAMNEVAPNWNDVLKLVQKNTNGRASLFNDQQNPIFSLNLAGLNTPSTTSHVPAPAVVGNASVNQSMLSAITGLLNRNTDINSRVRMVDGIVSNYFSSSNVYVQTVGRDMATIVDTEDVATFLRRLCFDKKIRQINVITEDKDASGRCKFLKVHEVRDELGR